MALCNAMLHRYWWFRQVCHERVRLDFGGYFFQKGKIAQKFARISLFAELTESFALLCKAIPVLTLNNSSKNSDINSIATTVYSDLPH
jgi:hypothetical protein